MIVACEWSLTLDGAANDDALRDQADRLMAELVTRESVDTRLHDVALGLDCGRRELAIEFIAEGADEDDAVSYAMGHLREAMMCSGLSLDAETGGGQFRDWRQYVVVREVVESVVDHG